MASQFAIRLAAHHVRSNGIIIYPTETVYGLGCNPNSSDAVNNLSNLKQRDKESRFLLLASNIDQLNRYITAPTPDEYERINLAETATSWITRASKTTPSWLVAADGSIGFRITTHPITKELCEHLNHPIISTSANIKGGRPVSNTLQCHQLFAGNIDYLLTSNFNKNNKPSTIRNLATGQQLR